MPESSRKIATASTGGKEDPVPVAAGGPAPSPSSFSVFVATLKEFKELIGIIIFFGAGLLWVGGYFATKAQLDELQCLTQAQIDLLRSEGDFDKIKADMLSISLQLDELSSKSKNGTLTAMENRQFHELSANLEDLKKTRAAAQERSDGVRYDIDHNACAGH
jgi:hypothetical protein